MRYTLTQHYPIQEAETGVAPGSPLKRRLGRSCGGRKRPIEVVSRERLISGLKVEQDYLRRAVRYLEARYG
jgi:hypothetical protein